MEKLVKPQYFNIKLHLDLQVDWLSLNALNNSIPQL